MLEQFDATCRFYGLEAHKILVDENYYNKDTLTGIIRSENAGAIVISADLLDIHEVQNTFLDESGSIKFNIPVLIADVTSETDPSLLELWSNGTVSECVSTDPPAKGYFAIEKSNKITAQLGGFFIPFKVSQLYHLKLDRTKSEVLIRTSRFSRPNSVFARVKTESSEIYFLSRIDAISTYEISNWKYRRSNFFQYAPWLFFLRSTCSDRCYVTNGYYANFTVDDPWLTDPYGYFSFKEILPQMKKIGFHTTIAFIPWNFDRSRKDVVDLIKHNSEYFSICIHGNNHDPREFNDHNPDFGDFAKPISFKEQETNIKQAIARMEKFNELTGISYDKVMVFPHEEVSASSLILLKKYNFISTINASSIPPDSLEKVDPVWKLRSVNNIYDNFPSLERYNAEDIIPADIAIDLFLGNPVLIYAHQDFFNTGMDRFNVIARKINRMQPQIKWTNLSEISRKVYLKKSISDSLTEIKCFSNEIVFENKEDFPKTFILTKEENDPKSLKEVTINGEECDYTITADNSIIISVKVQPVESCFIKFVYKNSYNRRDIDIAKNDWNVNILRKFSDFRDMSISTNSIGQMLIGFYYESGLYRLGVKRGIVLILLILSILIAAARLVVLFLRRRTRKEGNAKAGFYKYRINAFTVKVSEINQGRDLKKQRKYYNLK